MKNALKSLLILLVLSFCAFITACQCNQHHARIDKHAAQQISDYEGLYKGTLPCADCPGIATSLTLNKDKTFVYETCYLEKENGKFSSTGTYTVKEDLLTIEENGDPIHFLIGGDELFLLDKDLKPATGELADHYTLKKEK